MREHAAMEQISGTVYLSGGLGMACFSDLMAMETAKFTWRKVNLDFELSPRSQHSANQFRKQLILFGGHKGLESESK
jgi:hypothetical protein